MRGLKKKRKRTTKIKGLCWFLSLLCQKIKEEKFQYCISPKEIWKTLKNYYKGNIQVRSKKVQFHVYEYKLFKMKPHKCIIKMTNRLNVLLTTFRKLGEHYSKEEFNIKILRMLPKKD